jgi:hypothetical protein
MIGQYKCIIILLFFFIQLVPGIEVDYSLNDLDVNTQYDVDNSVYVYEEISGDPQLTAIRDYREVSGGDKKDLKQKFSSGSYTAISGVKADSGSVESTAYLTSTFLSATQRSNIGGSFAQSFLAGSQDYFGGIAFTGQYVGVNSGILSSVQSLSLGQSIYSTQIFQANGNNPLAVGYALIYFDDLNGFDSQGAFIAAGACKEGSISGNMGAEVIKVPEAIYIDPVAYGSNIVARGDEAAGIIAGAGNLKGFRFQGQFVNFNGLEGQGAFTGALGIGEGSLASVDYIEARTDGHVTFAFEKDAKAKGDKSAIVAAGAGSFNRNVGFGFDRSSFFSDGILDMQGAFAGATAIGEDSRAKASLVGAITDGEITSAWGEDLKAKSDGFAAVGAGAGNFYRNQGLGLGPFYLVGFDNLGIQGAIAGTLAGGENSKASADLVSAMTDGKSTFSEGRKMLASGDKFAATGGGAGGIRQDYGVSPIGPYYYLDTQGAIVADIGLGKDSSASADYVSAGTNGHRTYAFGENLEAKGKTSAQAIAGAGDGIALVNGRLEIDDGSVTGLSAQKNAAVRAEQLFAVTGVGTQSFGTGLQAIGDESALAYSASGNKLTIWADSVYVKDGTLTGLGAKGRGSRVMAENLFSGKAGDLSISYGNDLRARGKEAIAVSSAGQMIKFQPGEARVEIGSLTGLAANGDARVTSAALASYKDSAATFSTGGLLAAEGDNSAALASGSGAKVTIQSDEDKGKVKVEQGSITGLTAYEDARVTGVLLASGGLSGVDGSMGYGLSASGAKSASGASGVGEKVVIKSNEEKGKAKVKEGGIVGMAAHDGAQVDADLLGSIDLGGIKGWIGLNPSATGLKAATGTGFGSEVVIEADGAKVEVVDGSLIGLTAYGANARTSAASMGGLGIAPIAVLSASDVLAEGERSANVASGSGTKVTVESKEKSGSIEVASGSVVGQSAFGNARVTAGTLNFNGLLPSGTDIYARGDHALATLAAGNSIRMETGEDANQAKVDIGMLIGVAADNGEVSADSLGFNGLSPEGLGLKASGTKAVAASATGLSTVLETNKVTVNTGYLVGLGAENGEVTADNLGSNGLTPSGSGLKASGTSAIAASAIGLGTILGTDKVTVDAGSMVGLGAENGEVTANSLGFNGLMPSGSGLKASGTKAVAASATGLSTVLETNKVTVNAGSMVGLAAEGGQVTADSMGFNGLYPEGLGLKAAGSKTVAASATGLSTILETDKVTVNTGSMVGLAAGNVGTPFDSEVTADRLGFNGLTPSGSGLKASGMSAIAASATGLSTVLEIIDVVRPYADGKVTVNAGSLVGLAAGNGEVTADSLGFNGLSPEGLGLKASGLTAIAASATGLSTILETNKATVNAGSMVGLAAAGNGEVTVDSLGSNGLTPSGSGLKASGASAIAASATGLSTVLETSVYVAGKVTVNTGSLVGLAAENGEVTADSLGFNGLSPEGFGLRASGASAIAASATGLSTVLETNKITINSGSLVGLAASNGEVSADNLGYNGVSSIGSGLAASGDKSIALAGAGNKITLQPNTATVEAQPLDANGVLLALGAGGSSQVSATSLEASKGLTSSTAKGSGLQASGQNYAMIGVASSGSITGGTIINFQPSSSSSPYYGITIPWGAYGGARANGGTVTATTPLMAKAEGTNYVIGGPGATTSIKDYAYLQATGTSRVVFAAYTPTSIFNPNPSVATKTDGLVHQVWAFKSLFSGDKKVN